LFIDLGASDEQLDFPVIYSIGRDGVAKLNMEDENKDLTPLLDMILREVPPASSETFSNKPFRAQVFNLAYDNFLGRLAISRIYEGSVKQAQNITIKKPDGTNYTGKISKMFTFKGLERQETEVAQAGDIVVLAGIPDIFIGETICEDDSLEALPAISVDEPTICLNFLVNNSPLAGQDGKLVTSRQIKERLEKELEVNVGLKIDFSATDYYKVYGRGELHIAILLENMRREGYELQVSQPQVIIKEEDGKKLEPFEEITIDIPNESSGVVIEKIAKRKGTVTEMRPELNHTRIIVEIPTRGLLGYRNEFTIDTRGEGIICSRVLGFRPHVGEIEMHFLGSMVSMMAGKTLAFSLANLQERGELYIEPNIDVYTGMVIGNVSKGNDLDVNPIKGKHLTNMRAAAADVAIKLTPPITLTLENGLSLIKKDEYLEVTPRHIRLRKQ